MIKPDLEGVKKTLQEFPFPADVIVEVTRHCNLRCIMCPYPNLKRPAGDMTFEVFKKIIDEVASQSPSTRVWLAIMGEPTLLKERLVTMIKYAKEHGIQELNLNTNAVYLDAQLSRRLIEVGTDKILVSIDGATKESYDKIRVGGNFAAVVQNVEALLAAKRELGAVTPDVIAQFIVMEENEQEVDAFRDFWLARGAVVKIRPKLGWGSAVQSSVLECTAETTERFPCAWLTRTVSIHWDGTFSQCDADHEGLYSPGTIHERSIQEIWRGEIAARRQRHWNLDFDFEPCKSCKDWLAGRSYFHYPEGDPRA